MGEKVIDSLLIYGMLFYISFFLLLDLREISEMIFKMKNIFHSLIKSFII
jgi:hypothetical protein